MPIYQVIVLAVIQGLTEFLPVSSTAHLVLAPWLLGWKDPGLPFDIALHAGTLAALVLYFFRDWMQMIAHAFGMKYGNDAELKRNPGLFWLIVIGTIPVGIAGLLFNKQAEGAWRNPFVIGGMLIGVGILMWIAESMSSRRKDIGQVSGLDAAAIGVAQALAVVPGTSRSGITITAGLFRDLDRGAAARFSFLLSTPALAAAVLKGAWDIKKAGGIPHDMRVPVVVGIVVSALVGAFVIGFLLDFLRRHTLKPFVYYRIVFGIIVIALAFVFPYAG